MQDCDPKTYSCTSRNALKKAKLSKGRLRSNGEAARKGPRRKDAQSARISAGARLPRHPPHFDKSLMIGNGCFLTTNAFTITVQQLLIRLTDYSAQPPWEFPRIFKPAAQCRLRAETHLRHSAAGTGTFRDTRRSAKSMHLAGFAPVKPKLRDWRGARRRGSGASRGPRARSSPGRPPSDPSP